MTFSIENFNKGIRVGEDFAMVSMAEVLSQGELFRQPVSFHRRSNINGLRV